MEATGHICTPLPLQRWVLKDEQKLGGRREEGHLGRGRAEQRCGGGPVQGEDQAGWGPCTGALNACLRQATPSLCSEGHPSLCPEDGLPGEGQRGDREGWPQGPAAESPCPSPALGGAGAQDPLRTAWGPDDLDRLPPSPFRVFHSCQGLRASLETTLCSSIGTFICLDAFASPA